LILGLEATSVSDALQKLLSSFMLWMAKELCWGSALQDLALVQKAHAVRDFASKAHLMSCEQHRHAI
jgi:hypothetical protein